MVMNLYGFISKSSMYVLHLLQILHLIINCFQVSMMLHVFSIPSSINVCTHAKIEFLSKLSSSFWICCGLCCEMITSHASSSIHLFEWHRPL